MLFADTGLIEEGHWRGDACNMTLVSLSMWCVGYAEGHCRGASGRLRS